MGELQKVAPGRFRVARRRRRLLNRVQRFNDGLVVQDAFGKIEKRPLRREGRSERLPECLPGLIAFER